jgi:hypothetical protein
MPESNDNENAISVSGLDQEVLEMGLIAHLLAYPDNLFMYAIMNISPACFQDPVARHVYCAIVQGIVWSHNQEVSIPVGQLNPGDTDALAIDLIRRAVAGGYPCMHSLAPCLLELHDRDVLAQLENEAAFDEEWERITQEYVPDDPQELPW